MVLIYTCLLELSLNNLPCLGSFEIEDGASCVVTSSILVVRTRVGVVSVLLSDTDLTWVKTEVSRVVVGSESLLSSINVIRSVLGT